MTSAPVWDLVPVSESEPVLASGGLSVEASATPLEIESLDAVWVAPLALALDQALTIEYLQKLLAPQLL